MAPMKLKKLHKIPYFSFKISREKIKKIFSFILVAVFSVSVFYIGQQYYAEFQEAKKQRLLYERHRNAWQDLQNILQNEIRQFKDETGIVIKDLQNNWEFDYNKDTLFPSASLAKLPIMAACFLAAEEGKLKLDREVKLESSEKLTGSGLLKNMRPGTAFTIRELIGLMIYESDNTATNMLTDMLGLDYLNSCFKAFGLKNTSLSRKVADFVSRDQGIENYTTAEDMAIILEKIYSRTLASKDVSQRCIKVLKLQRVNDRIPRYLPADIMTAHKTGLEDFVCHDAGIVFTCKGNMLICILTKHANPTNSLPSKEFIGKVALHAYNYIQKL